MSHTFKTHDHVAWNTPQGLTHGKIVRIISKPTTVDGHAVDASEDDPRYEVASDKSGKHAVHRGDALTLLKD